MPSFITIDCFRWLEHVGVSDDWKLGYRHPSELSKWKAADLVENPESVNVSKSKVDHWQNYYYSYFFDLFNKYSSYPPADPAQILTNVY